MSTADLTRTPAWQQSRALLLHGAFKSLAEAVEHEGANVVAGLRDIAARLDGKPLDGGKLLKASPSAVRDNYYRWLKGSRSPADLICGYRDGQTKIPGELVMEWQRRCTNNIGGRDMHGGFNTAAVYARLVADWREGKDIPGLGTWQEWWAATYPRIVVPGLTPEFPYCERTMYRHVPSKGLTKTGNIGIAAGRKHMPYVSMNYANLRKCELYTFDDVRLDMVAIPETTGIPVTYVCYVAMEVASRSIVAFVLRPHTPKAEDVDELVVRTLQTPGYGIGDGYPTHLLFERGYIACSPERQAKLEGFSDGGIVVHRTGVTGGVRWTGCASDRSSGKWAAKAVIEAFNGILHGLLQHLPGQRGNTWANQPANLGIEQDGVIDKLNTSRQTLVAEAERLYAAQLAALKAGANARMQMPLLLGGELRAKVAEAIALYNRTPGREFQGHGKRLEAEIAPGVWVPVDSITEAAAQAATQE